MEQQRLILDSANLLRFNAFLSGHKYGCVYHLPGWSNAIEAAYNFKTYMLLKKASEIMFPHANNLFCNENESVVGYLPLVHITRYLFSDSLISMPFCDSGGILSIDRNIERMLIEQGLQVADTLRVPTLELRQYQPLACLDDQEFIDEILPYRLKRVKIFTDWYVFALPSINKVRMLIDLPIDPGVLMASFKPKLRSQIRKPIKEGLIAKIGGIELIDDFYNIFAENMRDLGSPVHSKKFIAETLITFPNAANVCIIYNNGRPLAGGVTIGFKDTLSNPWASSLRRYSHLAPNMLLYWSMLEFACQNGYQFFDFGRSTPGEGTYKFKEQWGARSEPLYWYRFSKTGDQGWSDQANQDKMRKAIECWKKLPVPLTKIIGPRIRKYISL